MSHSAPDLPNFQAQRIGQAIALSDGDTGTWTSPGKCNARNL